MGLPRYLAEMQREIEVHAHDYGLDFFDVESRQSLPEVLRQAGRARPILFGHSDGATIALLFAAAFPEVPAAVVAVAGHVFIEEEPVAGVEEAAVAWRPSPG